MEVRAAPLLELVSQWRKFKERPAWTMILMTGMMMRLRTRRLMRAHTKCNNRRKDTAKGNLDESEGIFSQPRERIA